MFFDKKAQGISMTYIVIAALALIVLIVIVLFFTGGMEKIFKGEAGVVEGVGGEKATWVSRCRAYCSAGQVEVFNSVTFADGSTCKSLGVSCEGAGEEEGGKIDNMIRSIFTDTSQSAKPEGQTVTDETLPKVEEGGLK